MKMKRGTPASLSCRRMVVIGTLRTPEIICAFETALIKSLIRKAHCAKRVAATK